LGFFDESSHHLRHFTGLIFEPPILVIGDVNGDSMLQVQFWASARARLPPQCLIHHRLGWNESRMVKPHRRLRWDSEALPNLKRDGQSSDYNRGYDDVMQWERPLDDVMRDKLNGPPLLGFHGMFIGDTETHPVKIVHRERHGSYLQGTDILGAGMVMAKPAPAPVAKVVVPVKVAPVAVAPAPVAAKPAVVNQQVPAGVKPAVVNQQVPAAGTKPAPQLSAAKIAAAQSAAQKASASGQRAAARKNPKVAAVGQRALAAANKAAATISKAQSAVASNIAAATKKAQGAASTRQ
jgi:hypothetical protein